MYVQKEDEIAVIYSYARTGGTLISKCIASHKDNWILSEINPTLSVEPIAVQMERWYDVKGINFDAPYIDQLLAAKKAAHENGKNLIVRDWSHSDFVGFPWVKPSYKSSQQELLKKYFNIKEVATARHPFDVYQSINTKTQVKQLLYFPQYLRTYNTYTTLAKQVGFVRYEDFCKDPEQITRAICAKLNVAFDENFLNTWSNVQATGDIRAAEGGDIAQASYEKQEIKHPVYHRILERLSYAS